MPGGPIRFQEAARTPEPAPAGSVDSGKRLFRPIVAGDQGAGLRSCVRPAPIYDCKRRESRHGNSKPRASLLESA
jgi:hypothetical protein